MDLLLKLNLPVKRQKVDETEAVEFNLHIPAFEKKPLQDCKDFALEIVKERSLKGHLKYPVCCEVEMRPRTLKESLDGLTEEEKRIVLTTDYKKA
jgi:hypothetical protein